MALRNDKLAFIGCGTMGEAMVKGLLHEDLVRPEQIVVSHPRPERREDLIERYGVRAEENNADAAHGATVVVLSNKPQVMNEIICDLQGQLEVETLVISIVAGVRLPQLTGSLGTPASVRVMPNTPAQIGRGISVWTTTDAVQREGRDKTRTILGALGEEEFVTHENELDMATALSGTGPAYVFLFMEALVDAGVHMGFSRRVASRLVLETMRGSVEYAAEAPDHLARLRNQVTSPGGTTAEAHYQLEKGRLRTVLSDAVWAAYRRCVQLGEQAAPDHNGRPLATPKNDSP